MYGSFTSSSKSEFDNNNNSVQTSQQQKEMRISLAELKTSYTALKSEYDASQLLNSLYPYMSSDRNNPMFIDSTDNDNSLQSLKEKIYVRSILVNQ